MAGVATSSKLIVPHLSSTVSAACSAPGTTAGSSPSPCRFLFRDRYQSTLTALRRPALADDRHDLAFLLRVDQHQRFAAEAVEVLLEHAAGEQRGHAGIERVPALQQDAKRRCGRERMTGRHAAGRPHHGRPQCGACRLLILNRHLAGAGTWDGQPDSTAGDAGDNQDRAAQTVHDLTSSREL